MAVLDEVRRIPFGIEPLLAFLTAARMLAMSTWASTYFLTKGLAISSACWTMEARMPRSSRISTAWGWETKAARIVMASKLAGVPPQQITERLRDTYA